MKKLFSRLVLAGMMAFSLSSCDQFIENYDVDPTRPLAPPLTTVLSGAQVGFYQQHLGNMARNANGYAQALSGASLQTQQELELYQLFPNNVNNDWNNTYAGPLRDLEYIITTATADNGATISHREFVGIAKVMKALLVGQLTDMFGDIPYSQAFRGLQGTSPTYDAQQAVYNSIQTLLDEAIADLSAPAPTAAVLRPGGSDLMFGGNTARWVRVANILKARFHMRTSRRVSTATVATNVINALTAAGTFGNVPDNANNLIGRFGTTNPNGNPWFLFQLERGGQWSFGSASATTPNVMRRIMFSHADPREAFYYNGGALGPAFNLPNASLPIVTMAEAKFLEAEALLYRNGAGDVAAARTAMIEGIRLSQASVGVTSAATTTYLARVDVDPNQFSGQALFDRLYEEFYVALFTQYEVWNLTRRVNFPVLSPRTGTQLVVRYPYPQSEFDFNAANVPAIGSNLFAPLWFDN